MRNYPNRLLFIALLCTGICIASVLGTAAPVMAQEEEPESMVDLLASTEELSTLVDLLELSGLLTVLSEEEGPYTVFAPTDAAFEALPEGTLDRLLSNPELLSDVLEYHLVVDAVPAEQLIEFGSALTFTGDTITVLVDDDGAVLINDATVLEADIDASDGILHIIDTVLTPPVGTAILPPETVILTGTVAVTGTATVPVTGTATLPVTGTATLPGTAVLPDPYYNRTLEELAAEDTADMTILEIVNSIKGLETLAVAVETAGLEEALSETGPYTLFAPTNEAFDDLPEGALDNLLNDDGDALVNLLQYHLLVDPVNSAELAELGIVLNANGTSLVVSVAEDGVITVGGAVVFQPDIEAANGIIHVIGSVLQP